MSSGNHVERRSEYHFVFVTKCRFKMMKRLEIKSVCEQAFHEVEQKLELEIKELNIQSEHVHMLVALPPVLSISEVVQRLKGVSARRLFQAHPNFRKRLPRGAFWSGWYYYGSVGPMTEAVVRRYIRDQPEDPAQQTLTGYCRL